MSCQEKHGEFFPHERSNLALQNDDFLMDPVIFAFFLRNPCVCNGSGSGLEIFDFGPEPRKHKNQKKKLAPGPDLPRFCFSFFTQKNCPGK